MHNQDANKRTPLYDEHVSLGAAMVPFGGWDMPVYYSTVIEEHKTVRAQAGLFDTSHMGEFEVAGPDACDLLESLLSNNISQLEPGAAVYTAMTNNSGGAVDDLWVYMLEPEKYLLVVNASTADKDREWIVSHVADRALTFTDRSADTGMIALQGPAFEDVLKKVCADPPPARFHCRTARVADCEVLVSRTGYTGEDGVELYLAAGDTVAVWCALLEAGGPLGLKPVGLGARDTLRLEACYSLYGHELSEDITPVEAGISFAVATGKSYPGSHIIEAQLKNGPERKVAAFELVGRGIPREGYPIFAQGEQIGAATSGCFSPSLKKGIGLAMIKTPFATPGTAIEVEIRKKRYDGRIVKKPFVRNI